MQLAMLLYFASFFITTIISIVNFEYDFLNFSLKLYMFFQNHKFYTAIC